VSLLVVAILFKCEFPARAAVVGKISTSALAKRIPSIRRPRKLDLVSCSGPQFRRPWDIVPKICLGYWRRLVPNFAPIGEVPVEKTVNEQKKRKTKKEKTANLVSLSYYVRMNN